MAEGCRGRLKKPVVASLCALRASRWRCCTHILHATPHMFLHNQITFLALYRLLDFGGEFDGQLHAAAKRGVRETMQFGALGLHLGACRYACCFQRTYDVIRACTQSPTAAACAVRKFAATASRDRHRLSRFRFLTATPRVARARSHRRQAARPPLFQGLQRLQRIQLLWLRAAR